MSEGCPGTELLELQHGLASGFEGACFLRGGGQGSIGSVPGLSYAAEEGLEEVGGEFLVGVAVGGAEFVEHPHELLEARGVLVGDGTCSFEKDVVGPVGGEVEREGGVAGGREGQVGGGWCSGGRVGLIGIVVLGRRRG